MKRLVFISPDITHARKVVDALQEQDIDRQHIYTITPRGVDREGLPGPGTKSDDFLPGYLRGLLLGAVAGLVAGVALFLLQSDAFDIGGTMVLLVTLLGAGIGGLGTGIAAASFSNSRVEEFRQDLTMGKILIMADVESDQQERTEQAVRAIDPATKAAGEEPAPKVVP